MSFSPTYCKRQKGSKDHFYFYHHYTHMSLTGSKNMNHKEIKRKKINITKASQNCNRKVEKKHGDKENMKMVNAVIRN